MYQVYVKCEHVSRLRDNEITVWHENNDFNSEPTMYIHMCASCKAVLGARWSKDATLDIE